MTQEAPISFPEADVHLTAEGLGDRLKHRSARGGALMIVSYGIQLLIGITGTAVLARLLTPTDFGYLAMVGSFIAFVITVREFLLAPAVQREELSHLQASGLFWINLLASVIVAICVAGMSPVLAWFFHEPRVFAITMVLSIGVFLSMAGMLHIGLLRRQMRFGAIATLEIGAIFAGVVVGVVSAKLGAGYWALVYQQMTLWIWQTGAACVLCPWRPASLRKAAFHSDEGVRSMLRYGQSAAASRFVTYFGRNMDAVLVGHFLGAGALGLYQKAYQWAMTPSWQIFIPVTPVATASLSRLQNEPERYRLYVKTLLLGVFGLTLPGTLLLMVESDAVIRILMGTQWLDAIPILRILSIGAWFSILSSTLQWIYLAEGRTTTQFRWALVSAPVMIIGIASGLPWNALGVASGFSIAVIILTVPGIWFCLRRSPVTVMDFIESAWRPAISSILAGLGVWMLKGVVHPHWIVFAELILFSGIFTLLYAASWLILPGGMANLREFLRHFRELRQGAGG